MRLHQLLAFERSTRKRTQEEITKLHRESAVADLAAGVEKRYEPIVDDGIRFNTEVKPVALRADDAIARFRLAWTEETNLVGRKEMANTGARAVIELEADSTVAAVTFGEEVPATYLLFLEKQLEHVRTFVAKMAELPPGEEWVRDGSTGLHRTAPKLSYRAEKVHEVVHLFQPTDKHPGQAQQVERQKVVGTWHTTLFNGGIEPERKRAILARIARVQKAVKAAREKANEVEVPRAASVADEIMDYVFMD